MRTKREILIAKLFDNPLGRLYLGVPKNKKIYKITKFSAHYYTGEISAKNGMPLICTGNCSPNGRLKFIHWLETWKPIRLCWLFLKMGWKIPKYFIGLDTGYKSPTATGGKYNNFDTPTNAYSSNNVYAHEQWTTYSQERFQSYESFGFGIPAGATIIGVEASIENYYTQAGEDPNLSSTQLYYFSVSDGNVWSAVKNFTKFLSEDISTVGGAADLWGRTPIDTDFSDANFSIRIYGKTGSGHDGIVDLYVDHIQVKVYYTEAAGPSGLKSVNGVATASIKTINGVAIASVKSINGIA